MALVQPHTAGDPMRAAKWLNCRLRAAKWLNCRLRAAKWLNCRLRALQSKLAARAYRASLPVLSRLLRKHHYSLRANRKDRAGNAPAGRDTQFDYLHQQRQTHQQAGEPVLSVDTKKKEVVGDFKNAGHVWCQQAASVHVWCQQAASVHVHDFPSQAQGRAVPYGLYDLTHNRGSVYVGQSADTPEFAVDNPAHWCQHKMPERFPNATKLLLHADCGGSSGVRCKRWKQLLQEKIADPFGLEVTVCHCPTGCSKWNPIEHRLFRQISRTWAGCPLRSFETILEYLRTTTTTTGLKVLAYRVTQTYQKGIEVAAEVMAALNITAHETCPQWNYTIRPRNKPLSA